MLRMLLGLVASSTVFVSAVLAEPPDRSPAPKSGVFEFVGYSSTPRNGVDGIRAMYGACQDDFGLDARVCTQTEFFQSPNVEIPSSSAWLGSSTIPTSGGTCNYWGTSVPLLGTGQVVVDFEASGKIRLLAEVCASELPVTCCARLQ